MNYTDKVLRQAAGSDIHAFPEIADVVADEIGEISFIKGGDGVWRILVRFSGEYKGYEGVFEWIIDFFTWACNHRMFRIGG